MLKQKTNKEKDCSVYGDFIFIASCLLSSLHASAGCYFSPCWSFRIKAQKLVVLAQILSIHEKNR